MKKNISILMILAFLSITYFSCREEKKDNTLLYAGALLLNQRRSGSGIASTSGTVTQQRQVSTARAGATSAASAARSSSGRTAFLEMKMKETAQKLMAMNIEKAKKGKKFDLKNFLSKHSNSPKSILTFASCVDANNATCDGSDTTMTYNGVRTCGVSGNMTANAFRVTYSGATQDTLNMTMSGGISYAACKENAIDFQNYPNTIQATLTSGAVSINGTYSYSDTTSGSTTLVFEEKNDFTVNSTTDIVFAAGSTAVKVENLTSKQNLKTTYNIETLEYLSANGTSLCKGSTACSSISNSTVFGQRSVFVLDGTLAITGKVGGADAGLSLNLSNRSITFSYQCSKSIFTLTEADYAEGSTVCSYRIN
jgi:hypothetical protein